MILYFCSSGSLIENSFTDSYDEKITDNLIVDTSKNLSANKENSTIIDSWKNKENVDNIAGSTTINNTLIEDSKGTSGVLNLHSFNAYIIKNLNLKNDFFKKNIKINLFKNNVYASSFSSLLGCLFICLYTIFLLMVSHEIAKLPLLSPEKIANKFITSLSNLFKNLIEFYQDIFLTTLEATNQRFLNLMNFKFELMGLEPFKNSLFLQIFIFILFLFIINGLLLIFLNSSFERYLFYGHAFKNTYNSLFLLRFLKIFIHYILLLFFIINIIQDDKNLNNFKFKMMLNFNKFEFVKNKHINSIISMFIKFLLLFIFNLIFALV
jgi:hypothetical protein